MAKSVSPLGQAQLKYIVTVSQMPQILAHERCAAQEAQRAPWEESRDKVWKLQCL